MKVGINARTFHVSEPEGAVQASLRQTRELKSIPSVEILLFGNQQLSQQLPEFEVDSSYYPRVIPSQFFGVIWERLFLPRSERIHELDVLYCPNANGPLRPISCPTVVAIHDVNAQLGISSGIHQLYRKSTVPKSILAADLVVTVSNFSKREIVRTLPVQESKIRVIYNGVNEFYLSDKPGDPLPLPDEYVLFVGSMNPRKNIPRLIEGFRDVKDRHNLPHNLVLAGPPNRVIFKNMDVSESECLQHVGFLSPAELKYAYQHATVFAYPSLYEGFGLPPLEAMACGTAVLASDQGPFDETLGSAAELVDPKDTKAIATGLEQLLLDDEYRAECERQGEERAQKFTWNEVGSNLYSALQEVA